MSLNRTLQDGTIVPAIDIAVELKVLTKCPSKYKLVDMETGLEYTGVIPDSNEGYFWKRTDT